MNSIRVRITIDLNGNHALSVHQLQALKPFIERGIASFLPDSIRVDRIRATRIRETSGRAESEIAQD
ncbi:MAG: hypothetical protein H0U23_00020 [Blastocatellia bacterium]|nr:hypothetical protein [Blastocatellia bacterium]